MPDRLRSSQDVRRVMAARRSAGADHVVAHAARNDLDHARVAVVAGRRVGNAVTRNRAKRRIRSVLRHAALPAGCDLVVTGKAGAESIAFTTLQGEVRTAVARAAKKTDAR